MSERVAAAICTHQPEALKAGLDSLAAQILPEGLELHIVVVDADEQMSSRAIVNEFRRNCRYPITYVHQPEQGCEPARRAALDAAALYGCGLVAFVGADEIIPPNGIAQLVRARAEGGNRS